jgi:hypothetical protein
VSPRAPEGVHSSAFAWRSLDVGAWKVRAAVWRKALRNEAAAHGLLMSSACVSLKAPALVCCASSHGCSDATRSEKPQLQDSTHHSEVTARSMKTGVRAPLKQRALGSPNRGRTRTLTPFKQRNMHIRKCGSTGESAVLKRKGKRQIQRVTTQRAARRGTDRRTWTAFARSAVTPRTSSHHKPPTPRHMQAPREAPAHGPLAMGSPRDAHPTKSSCSCRSPSSPCGACTRAVSRCDVT